MKMAMRRKAKKRLRSEARTLLDLPTQADQVWTTQHGQWQKIPHPESDGRLQSRSFGHRGGHVFARSSRGRCARTTQTGTRDDRQNHRNNGPEFLSRAVDQ